MSSALKATKLKRLTIMSSFASVVDLSKNPRAGYTYTDKDWDPVTIEKGQEDGYWGYHASKTFAERAAWDMWKEAKPSWDLVTFCPPMIYGNAQQVLTFFGHH
jgi:nucleoside-diphosphate-sugar epimerase